MAKVVVTVYDDGVVTQQQPSDIDAKLDQVLAAVATMGKAIETMSSTLQEVQAADTAMDAAIAKAVAAMGEATTTVQQLAGKIVSAGTDPGALNAIVTDLNTHSATLSAATDALTAASSSVASGAGATTVAAGAGQTTVPAATSGVTLATDQASVAGAASGADLTTDQPAAAKPV